MSQLELQSSIIRTKRGVEIVRVRPIGAIDEQTHAIFAAAMERLLQMGYLRFLLDLGRTEYVNSSGMGRLLSYADECERRGGALVFCNIPTKVLLVMEMLAFDGLFKRPGAESACIRLLDGLSSPASWRGAEEEPPAVPGGAAATLRGSVRADQAPPRTGGAAQKARTTTSRVAGQSGDTTDASRSVLPQTGALAMRFGFCSLEQIQECLRILQSVRQLGLQMTLTDVLYYKRLITLEQLQAIRAEIARHRSERGHSRP